MLRRSMISCSGHVFYAIVIGLTVWTPCAVDGACPKVEKKLWAYSNPSTEHFTDTYKSLLSSDKGERCKWIITAADDNDYVKLSFSKFELKNSTKSDGGDCVDIYDDDGKRLDQLCDKMPQESYTSENKYLHVIYKRGEVEGDRQFIMTYSSISAMSSEKYIKIAGIVGAVVAGAGLVYVVIKVTKCCRCIRRRKANTDMERSGSTTRERARLVANVGQGGQDSDNFQNRTVNQNGAQPLDANALPSAPDGDGIAPDSAHHSDTDSLQDMNELPPSYESLYLTEQGEAVTPPKYSPPEHHATHPPRRVNTVN